MRDLVDKLSSRLAPALKEECHSLKGKVDFLEKENLRLKKELDVKLMTQRQVEEILKYNKETIRELSVNNEKLQKDINTVIDSRDKLRRKLINLVEGRTVQIYDDDDELLKILKERVDKYVCQSVACSYPDSSEEYKVEEDGYLIHVVRRYKGFPVIAKTYSCICLPRDFAIAQAQYLCELLNEKM